MKESWGFLEHSQALFQTAVAQAGLTQVLTFIGDPSICFQCEPQQDRGLALLSLGRFYSEALTHMVFTALARNRDSYVRVLGGLLCSHLDLGSAMLGWLIIADSTWVISSH